MGLVRELLVSFHSFSFVPLFDFVSLVALLVVFCILYLWMLWSYFMVRFLSENIELILKWNMQVIITPPGFARDVRTSFPFLLPGAHNIKLQKQHVSQSPPPLSTNQNQNQYHQSPPTSIPNGNHPDVEQGQGSPNGSTSPDTHTPTSTNHNRDSVGGPSYEDMHPSEETYPPHREPQAGVLDALPHPNGAGAGAAVAAVANGAALTAPQKGTADEGKGQGKKLSRRQERIQNAVRRAESHNVYRRPPTTPQLLPEHRYCEKDLFIKPYRTHHCRACGTVRSKKSPRMIPLDCSSQG